MKSKFLLAVIFLLTTGSLSYAQRVTLDFRQEKLGKVLEAITKQTGKSFSYSRPVINPDTRVSIRVTDEELHTVLAQIINTDSVEVEITENKIFLKPVQKKPVSESKRITGHVSDNFGEPVSGATIKQQGTANGTTSDADGNFEMAVPDGSILEISYIGYVTQTIVVGSKRDLDIQLEENVEHLAEVVVVGYGTMRKRDLTGSVIQVRPDKIANENPKTVQDILRGTPGLNVGYDASAKGGGSLVIRGQRSVYTDGNHNNPLLILDGMIFYGELSEINPDDIAQIDILKDASAAAVYGAKAASGVIIITTKKGRQGKPVVNITTSAGWSQRSTYRERFSPEENVQHRQDWYLKNTYGVNPATGAYEAYQSGVYASQPGYFHSPDRLPADVSVDAWRAYTTNQEGESDFVIWARRLGFGGNTLENLLAGKTVDWADKTFRTGFNRDYNASVSGANDKMNYYLSMGYLKNEGIIVSDDYRAIRANMKVDGQVNKWLEIGANVNFQDRSDGNIDIDQDQMLRNSPYADYADEKGNPLQYPLSAEYSQRGYNYDFQKQFLELEKGYTVLNTILNAKITLPFNVTYSFNASPRLQWFYDRYFMSADLPGADPASRGANREQSKRFDWSLNNTINWDYTFAQKHHVNLTLVQEAEERQFWKDRIEARKILPSDALGFHNTKNGTKENSVFSSEDTHQTADALLARAFYSYDDRYMLTASIRRDGYSAFGTSNPHATFPSLAVAWSFADEDFFSRQNVMSAGKLRVSYGKNGNRSLDNPYLALANLYEGAGKMQGYINSSGTLNLYRYLMAQRMANPNLQWEKTASWNFGLDFGFLNDRITGAIEYYSMNTNDMIMNQRLPSFTGFPSITTNLGQVDNRGVEISLNSLNVKNDILEWNTTLGFSYNKNEIRHLYYENEDVLDEAGNVVGTKEMDDISNSWFIGQPISAIWNFRVTGIWQADEIEEAKEYGQLPGDPKVANNYTADDVVNPDGSVTHVYNNKDKEFLGQTTPPVHWSLRNDFTLWKDLSISFNIYSYMGHKSLSGDYLNNDDDGGRMAYAMANLPKKVYWTVDNPTNKYGRIEAKGPTGAAGAQKLYDRSYIRFENISIGYMLPRKWSSGWDIERVKLYGSIRNVASWAKDWEYGDPETGGWASRIYTLGLNLTF
ncbi:MAG: SusC/RagA family TonB-linked outer membrane protein [Tannerella sp.]|jgi:TonB-linked SusC/RagA family outer membrane protein|nr:SusC/RagA family TonB-linked outer membrane protein [Tannerella sp.]